MARFPRPPSRRPGKCTDCSQSARAAGSRRARHDELTASQENATRLLQPRPQKRRCSTGTTVGRRTASSPHRRWLVRNGAAYVLQSQLSRALSRPGGRACGVPL